VQLNGCLTNLTSVLPKNSSVVIRPVQYRDLEELNGYAESFKEEKPMAATEIQRQLHLLSRWYGLLNVYPVLVSTVCVQSGVGNASGVAV